MTSKFNVPDEFIRAFVKAGQGIFDNFVQSYARQLADPRDKAQNSSAPTVLPSTEKLTELQLAYYQQQMELWMGLLARVNSQNNEAPANSHYPDRRFRGAEWRDNPYYEFLKQQYLINARLLSDMVETADVDEKTKSRLRFYSRQFVDSMSPSNYAATNPEVLRLAVKTQGESVKAGFKNLIDDLSKGRISITDEDAFETGKNIAVSKGSVIFENELIQLIQYAPLTSEVWSRPLVIVPPCINKFYILDLQPENSFVRYAVEQGYTVFMISWRNVSSELGYLTWDDYLEHGVIKAIEVALAITKADKANAIGWCVGGTILSTALAVLGARGDKSVASLTLFTAMLDFHDAGELGVFIDEQSVQAREAAIGKGGIYPAKELAFVFSTLRANDLIWPYVVNNYLKGKDPEAFDLLYWNSDSTNLPGPMYCYYLRNMYLENNLRVPNKLMACGVPLDLGKVDMPSYILATQEDHIVPWQSAYLSTQHLGGHSVFVLGASGHIAGVVNPPSKGKRNYWINGTDSEGADKWFETAEKVSGSWWPNWNEWQKCKAGAQIQAGSELGSDQYQPIELAPGRYVRERSD